MEVQDTERVGMETMRTLLPLLVLGSLVEDIGMLESLLVFLRLIAVVVVCLRTCPSGLY